MEKIIIVVLLGTLVLTGCTTLRGMSFEIGSATFDNYEGFEEALSKNEDRLFAYEKKVTMDYAGMATLLIADTFEMIRVVEEDREDVGIHYYGLFDKENDQQAPREALIEGEDAKVAFYWDDINGMNHAILEVALPKDFPVDLVLESMSGSIRVNEVKLQALKAKTQSGSIKIKGGELGDLNMSSMSGSISVEGLVCNNYLFDSMSGSVYINGSTVDVISGKSISGSVKLLLDKVEESINITSTSGSVEIAIKELLGQVSAESSSGSIEVLDEKGRSPLVVKVTDDDVKINVKTISGSIKVVK